jgi:hypothetical protein
VYRHIFLKLEGTDVIKRRRSYANQLLVAIDGTEYFSSKTIHCENCSHRELSNGKTNYFHSVLTPVIVQPGNESVISLEPEFIVPQDGHEKQDCEIQAAKRWVEKWGDFYAKRGVTLLGDDLFSREPFCRALKDKGLHFHPGVQARFASATLPDGGFSRGQWGLRQEGCQALGGKYAEIATYRFANKLPLTGEADALGVNWCEVTLTREDTGEQLYKNAFATDFEVTDTTVEAIVRDGRARWKVENENNNVLKTKGYHLEHNFGHGDHHLASLLLSLNLLAFLFHTV